MRDLTTEMRFRTILYDKLLPYGFIKEQEMFIYKSKILEDKFEIQVWIQNGNVSSRVFDVENECEYVLVNVAKATGEFVGKIKEIYECRLNDIIEHCSSLNVFQNPQSREIMEYIQNKYHNELEFLWKKFPENAIWRNSANQKWYAILIGASARKIGMDSDQRIEALNLRYPKEEIQNIVDFKKVFPGYHMNKSGWITIPLNSNLDNETLFSWVDSSYQLSLKK
ncbi:hypothetical protein HDR67_00750 [bacterium]|nr:hypothetical protein [bacterium]